MATKELTAEVIELKEHLLGQHVEFFCKTEKHGIVSIKGTIFGYAKGFGKVTLIGLHEANGGEIYIDPSTIAYFRIPRPSDRLTVIELPEDDPRVQFRLFNAHEIEIGYIDQEDRLHIYEEEPEEV